MSILIRTIGYVVGFTIINKVFPTELFSVEWWLITLAVIIVSLSSHIASVIRKN